MNKQQAKKNIRKQLAVLTNKQVASLMTHAANKTDIICDKRIKTIWCTKTEG